jgi:hypothetical protein
VTVDFNFDVDDYFQGTFNNDTFAERSKTLFLIEIAIDADDLVLSLGGLASEGFNASAERNNEQRINARIRARVSGRGTDGGAPVLCEGTATLVGRGTFPIVQ